ncbi:golgin subfamily B member 1 isoform X2 [Leptidea sinapis]|uniref:golgin subfamily B member 1 isoform X2 n=1 Tax=Leptidea sinapis TaxID=189913 RepID=UPI0021C2E3AB|nr:golgin subfamily B member 1 isoform X2 [Leptidea sinapis]
MLMHHSPKKDDSSKLIFSGNFTPQNCHFDIKMEERSNMRKDILNTVLKRTESIMLEQRVQPNPLYEDPKDLTAEKPTKPPRKRNIHALAITSPRQDKPMKELKKKLTKKYEGLVTALMDKCEENVTIISEKDTQIGKLKEKLKAVLEYNRMFSEECDRVKSEHDALLKYVNDCKRVVREEKEKRAELEIKHSKLEEKMKQYEMPDRDHTDGGIPLVEVCMSCSSRQIVLKQARELNNRLQKDMQAMKEVLYRLNVQLSRYQEKLRVNSTVADVKDCKSNGYDLDSLITASFGHRQDGDEENKPLDGVTRSVDVSGLLSAQALVPLFDAYQENLQEKDNLIQDYEKQFENMNKKSKDIVTENKCLTEKIDRLDEELTRARLSYKKVMVEKETGDIERATLLERADKAETKLKEVYELYEDKIATMMRDYETVHREYFTVKSALETSSAKLAQMDALRARTVPADLHERRLEDCKRLLEELKHQYSVDTERKAEQIKKIQDELNMTEEKYNKINLEHQTTREELRAALKNVKLYRRAAVVYRHRARSAAARASRVSRAARSVRDKRDRPGERDERDRPGERDERDRPGEPSDPLQQALHALETIKNEIKTVKSRAHSSLEELERRIIEQERRAERASREHARELERAERASREHVRELERAELALRHKEDIIRSLIDKVADVEEVRLSQTNSHRLQGIVSNSSSSAASLETKTKLLPGPGGYFKEGRIKTHNEKQL